MKKIVLLLALCAGTGKLMAQNVTIAPFDATLNGKLMQPLKMDSIWRKPSTPSLNTELFKQNPVDIKSAATNNALKDLLTADRANNMPVAQLDGYSKMPVVVLEGNSKMPIVGMAPKKAVAVNP